MANNAITYVQPGRDDTDANRYLAYYGSTDADKKKHLPWRTRTPMQVTDYFSYDSFGNPLSSRRVNYKVFSESAAENANPYIRTESTYTSDGNYSATTKDARGNVVSQVVNQKDGMLQSVTDPTNQTVNYTYDASKRVTGVTTTGDGKTYKNAYTYENDRIKTVSHNTTGDAADVTYTFHYDELGRKTTVKVGSQTLSTNVYENDRDGQLSEVQYGNGGKVHYSYDDFDRLTGVRYDGETSDRYVYKYGANGEAAEVEDHSLGRIARTDYDQADRPCQTELRDASTGEALYKTSLKYDKLSNLEQFSEKAGGETHTSKYTYDRDNRATAIQYDGGAQKVSYAYDAIGRVSSRVAECGADVGKLTSTYSYVDGGFGTNSTTPLVKKITQNGISFEYAYDTRGNIISEKRGNLTTTYAYDALGQLIRVNDPHENATWVYSYDRGGNILSKAKYAYTTGALGAAVETIPYTYGDSNWKDKLTAYNGTAITYDAIGNPLNDGMWTYEWQAGRQLKKMTREGQTLTFKYDHNGMRIQKVLEHDWYPETTKYTYHGKLLTHMTVDYHDWDEVTQQDKLHFFYDAQSRPAKVVYNGVTYTYVQNLQGDIVGMLDSAGALVVEYKYDAWGKLLGVTGSLADTLGVRNPFRYRGYIYDGESELYYLRSRYFTPVVGRFVNADAQMGWTSLMGKNMYLYCMNAPSLLSDSNGFSPVIEPRPSRPENWDADYRAEFRRERMQALVRKAAKAVMQAIRNVNLYRMVLQLANHGGGVIKFKSGSKATCYTSAYWYKKNRPEADWESVGLDALFIGAGNLASRVPFFAKCSPYIEGITDALVIIHACNNLQIKQINRCIDSSGSIGWISWERSLNCAPIPTAWDSTTFTPAEWFGEIEYVEFFE